MRKRFSLNEECSNLKSSSDSEEYYTLDNLDLLNLKVSFSSDASNKLVSRKSKKRLSKGRNRGSGNGDEYNSHPNRRIKTNRHRKIISDSSDELQRVRPSKALINERQHEDRSVLLLYTNKLNKRRNSPSKAVSEEFLLPPQSTKRSSKDRSSSSQSNTAIGRQRTDAMTVSDSSSKRIFPFASQRHCNVAQGSFPFKVTPSGNLKVNSQQVVFESEKLSVLVANPETTTIDIADDDGMAHRRDQQHQPSMEQHDRPTMDQIMNQGLVSGLGSFFGNFPEEPPRRDVAEMEATEYEGRPTNEILDPEVNLDRLGYTEYDPIDWDVVKLPEKKNLYLELFSRITNFTNADCKVYIDNEEFNCHLIVLQCYSEVFHAYVAVKKVELPSDKCSAASFAFIYEWMISGDPSYTDLTHDNVLDIFTAAKYLKIRDLVEQCWAFIDNTLVFTEDSAFMLYVDAKQKGLSEVMELMLPRIQGFFLMLVSSQDWLELDVEDIQNFLQSNYISVNGEMEVFMAAVRWLQHDVENREKYKVAVLSCIRFGNIAPWQLVDIKRNPENPDFRELARDPDICKMIDDGLAYVIIKYWYGQENDDFHHWNLSLALKEPAQRNWSGTERTYFTYREFLIFLDQYRRRQIIEKSQQRERNKKAFMAEAAATACSSTDKLAPKVPTIDEFLTMRKFPPLTQPKKTDKCLNNLPMRTPGGQPLRQCKAMTQDEAAQLIQKTYRKYLLRKRFKQIPTGNERLRLRRRFSARRATNQEFPWKSSHEKVVNMFKKMEHLEMKYARRNRSSLSQVNDQFSDISLFIYDKESIMVFGGIDPHSNFGVGNNNGRDIYRYIADRNIWEFVGQMPEPRHHHCVAYLKGKIFIVGGADPREEDHKGKAVVVSTVWGFDPTKKTWSKEPSLIHKRKNFGLVVSEKYLFAIGGQGFQGRTLASVERLNVHGGGNWEKCSSMLHSRMGVACAKFEEKIWAAGGMSGSKRQPLPSTVECYDIETNQWTEIGKLRHPRCFSCLFPMSNKLYLIGGAGRIHTKDKTTTSLASIDVWNADKCEWNKISEMTIPRHGHAVAYLGTQIFIIGGITTIYMRALSNIECFCGIRGSWIRGVAPLPTYLSGHAALTLPPGKLV